MKFNIKSIIGPSLLLAISSLLSRFLGVYRDHLFAKNFGASSMLDSYYAAFRIPDILYAFLIMSSISVVFLPMFQKFKEKKDWDKAWKFTSSVLNSLLILFGLISITTIIFAPSIVNLYVPNFSEAQKELTVFMMRIMMISPFFFMISSVMISVENAFNKFFAQSLAPILYNLGIIGSLFIFKDTLGVKGLAVGVAIGAFLQMLIQVPFFLQTDFKWSAVFLKGKELSNMIKIVIPRILSVSADQIALTISTFLASSLIAGSITVLNLAINIQSLPFGMIAISVSITAFASLTKYSAQDDKEKFRKTLQLNFEKIMFWLVPSVFGLFIIANPLIEFLFEYGEFSAKNTVELVVLLKIFLIAVIFQGIIPLLSKSFFAYQKTWIVFFLTLVGLTCNVLTSIFLVQRIGITGLAWGVVVGMSINAILLIIFSWREYGKIFSFLKIFMIFLMSGIMFLILKNYLVPQIENLFSLWQILIITIVGGGVYLLGMKNIPKFYE